ncbi:MAG: hypothetical protein N2513_01295 [Deltaproteobacteria bacterium]|nr:hypothetical protein [Deltaproteobacteria bacterium]
MDRFLTGNLDFLQKLTEISYLLDLDMVAIPYEKLQSLKKGSFSFISAFFVVVNIQGIFSTWLKHFGFIETLRIIARDSEKLYSLSERYTQEVLKCLSVIKEYGFDGIAIVDDVAGTTGPFFSKRIFDKLFRPFLLKIIEKAKSQDLYVFFHSDGYVEELLNDIVLCGVDCLYTWDPVAKMDVYRVKNLLSGNVSFMGTIDLMGSDKKKIELEIERAEKEFSKGGLILGSSCGLSEDIPVEKLAILYPKILNNMK